VLRVLAGEQVVGADRSHHEAGGDDRPVHRVRVLPAGPGVEEERAQAPEREVAAGSPHPAHGVLHPRIGGDDEVAREPRAREHRRRGEPVAPGAEPPLAEEEEAEEPGLEKEREDALHRERLPDHAPRRAREARPVRPELKLHRDAGDDSHREVDREDPAPEARGRIVPRLAGAQRRRLEEHDEEREPHRELREEVVKGDGEGEVEAVAVSWSIAAPAAWDAGCPRPGGLTRGAAANRRRYSTNAPLADDGHSITTFDPTCWNGGVGSVGGCGSPGKSTPQSVHCTSVHAGLLPAGGVLASVALIQSTIVGTPPLVSVYTLSEPHIVCREPVPT